MFQSFQKSNLYICTILLFGIIFLCSGCRFGIKKHTVPTPSSTNDDGLTLKYVIQVGAFGSIDNALRLVAWLHREGIDAYYFRDKSGLFKVRIGNFPTLKKAEKYGDTLIDTSHIEEYFIVPPENRIQKTRSTSAIGHFRNRLVRTAMQYLGYPFIWGGETPEKGFDCSGLTMAVYRLHGFNLPHSSREQYKMGRAVSKFNLDKGDLVFFATEKPDQVSHVGIYVGGDQFIHAPGRNKVVRRDSIHNRYYKTRFLGARAIL